MPSIELVQRFVRSSAAAKREEEEDEGDEGDDDDGQTMLQALAKATEAVSSRAAPKPINFQLGDKVVPRGRAPLAHSLGLFYAFEPLVVGIQTVTQWGDRSR